MLKRTALSTLLFLALGVLPALALAAPPPMDVQHFKPHGDRTGWFVTESAQTLEMWKPAFGMWLSYANKPLVRYVDGEPTDLVVKDLLTMDLQAAIGFGMVDLALDLPIHLAVGGDGYSGWSDAFSGSAVGDLRLLPKVRFLDPDKKGIGLGLALPLTFPTGDSDSYVGRRTVSFSPTLLVTGHVGMLRLGGNLGYRIAGADEVDDLTSGKAFLYRVAASVQPVDALTVGAEIYGEAHSIPRNNPAEWLAGVTIHPVSGLGISLAAGTALGQGYSSPEGRIVFGIGYTPTKAKDTDEDGIPDKNDDCPEDPEDIDEFEDSDGCPDIDNDGDGILDVDDACPNIAENVNGWEDEDGCLDTIPDTDGDGLLDTVDQCINDPEDIDTFEDDDGCPDPDNDQDNILDVDDECPLEPEVLNGVDDEDGCPDEGKVRLDLNKKEIYIFEKVHFALNKATIKRESYEILDAVHNVLVKFPGITLVEVQGHTDIRGPEYLNQDLSQRRADAVKNYLVKKGIDAARLQSKGYGESKLLDTAETEEAHAKNRRVQFIVLTKE